jgi:hypothetical protein
MPDTAEAAWVECSEDLLLVADVLDWGTLDLLQVVACAK